MDTEDLQPLKNRKVLGVGYERTLEGYTLVIVVKGREYYLNSDTPIGLEVRDIH